MKISPASQLRYTIPDSGLARKFRECGFAAPISASRYTPATPSAASLDGIDRAAQLLRDARHPLLLIGRVSRDPAAWAARVALAERLAAGVGTDLKVGASFPTDHPLHVDAPGILLRPVLATAIAKADVILSLDWVDLAGTLKTACGGESPARVIQVSQDHTLHGGWSMDYQGLPPVDCMIAAEPDSVVPALLAALGPNNAPASYTPRADDFVPAPTAGGLIATDDLAVTLRRVVGTRRISLTHLPLSWNGESWPLRHPLDFLGSDGGGGIGGGPGISVGAALALRGSGILPVAVCGDGDFLMGATSLWTAAHYRIPLLLIVANNRSFYNDEVHQERVARMRSRPVENKWIGQRISDPDVDLAAIGRAQGAIGWGPIERLADLAPALEAALQAVIAGNVAVVDVHVQPGYTPSMTAALTATGRK